jgi:hypothetical protein
MILNVIKCFVSFKAGGSRFHRHLNRKEMVILNASFSSSKIFWTIWGLLFSIFGFTSLAMWGVEEGSQTLGFTLYQISKSDLSESEVIAYVNRADVLFKGLDKASSVLCTINPILRIWAVPYMNVARFQFQFYRDTLLSQGD